MEYQYFKGLEADRYSFYRVPKALVKADLFQKMSGDAKLLYAVLLDRMSLSIKNGWQDKHGNAYIICTIEEVMDSIHCARQKAVKLLDELEHEFRLIERRRQGLGKPNLLYVKDLYAGLSQSNYWKYENHTSGGLKNELPGVPKSNGSNTEKINKTDNSETDLIYPAELQEEEQYRRYFKEHNRGWYLGANIGMMAFDMSKPYIEGWKLKFEDRYCKGYGMMIGLCVGYEYQFGKRWLLDAFLGWAWMDSHYNGYSFDGQVDMYPHRPVQPEHPDPFNGSSEWYPNKIGVSIGYRIFTPRNKQRTADVR